MDARYYVTLERFLKAGDKAVAYTQGVISELLLNLSGDIFIVKRILVGLRRKESHSLSPTGLNLGLFTKLLIPLRFPFQLKRRGRKPNGLNPTLSMT